MRITVSVVILLVCSFMHVGCCNTEALSTQLVSLESSVADLTCEVKALGAKNQPITVEIKPAKEETSVVTKLAEEAAKSAIGKLIEKLFPEGKGEESISKLLDNNLKPIKDKIDFLPRAVDELKNSISGLANNCCQASLPDTLTKIIAEHCEAGTKELSERVDRLSGEVRKFVPLQPLTTRQGGGWVEYLVGGVSALLFLVIGAFVLPLTFALIRLVVSLLLRYYSSYIKGIRRLFYRDRSPKKSDSR